MPTVNQERFLGWSGAKREIASGGIFYFCSVSWCFPISDNCGYKAIWSNIFPPYFIKHWLSPAFVPLYFCCALATQLDRHILLIHLAKLQPKVLSVGLGIPKPVSFLVVVMKVERDCSKLPLETREDDKEEICEETAVLAAVKEISVQ